VGGRVLGDEEVNKQKAGERRTRFDHVQPADALRQPSRDLALSASLSRAYYRLFAFFIPLSFSIVSLPPALARADRATPEYWCPAASVPKCLPHRRWQTGITPSLRTFNICSVGSLPSLPLRHCAGCSRSWTRQDHGWSA
jgi:hypothetical protein